MTARFLPGRIGMEWHTIFISQKFRIFFFESETVIFTVLVPFLELDDQIDLLRILHMLNTVKGFDVNDSDAPQFNEMSGDVRCGSD
jgi:hypothetical protein